jgi:methionyl-tRNA formyltransferase
MINSTLYPSLVFMGTPAFAVPALEAILAHGYHVSGVVTVPDKPAGRGKKLKESDVKIFAKDHNLPVAQPENLRDPAFIHLLRSWNPDLIVVVAFRILPIEVFTIPILGTFNLHASLLPQYRGAAPIQRVIMNGEKTTGLTTFLLNDRVDTGDILLNVELQIGEDETGGELHDRMMKAGADLVIETIEAILNGTIAPIQQNPDSSKPIQPAPKINRDDCKICWTDPGIKIFNNIRALSPYPASFTTLYHPDQGNLTLRVFKAAFAPGSTGSTVPILVSDGRSSLQIKLPDGVISLLDVQLQDRKRMNINDFLNGFPILTGWKLAE